ncbi:MAG: hypothetical protein PHC28_07050 [Flavobacterium sp.]|uniref:hypothetical protein n=1 Tax=Flavobacterium sp. TaxID=239 RepID=UPI00261B3238|nr:hypothetical protein [Flavobacterium sp.]MDD5150228.1 hypothetical protein [Flavobacterium sp.]
MIDINLLLPHYGKLNRIFQNSVETNDISFDNQCFITDFHCKFSDPQEFDTMLANLVIELAPEKYSILFKKLYAEINKNLECYSQNKIFFDSINIEYKISTYAKKYDYLIEDQSKKVTEIRNDYKVVNGTLDSIGFREHTKLELEMLWKEHAYQKSLLEPEVLELNDLWKKKQELEIVAFKNVNNVFGKVYELSFDFQQILIDYLSEKDIQKDNSIENKTKYLNSRLIYSIYVICNGNIFEGASEDDYNKNFNLLQSSSILQKKVRKLYYICYLIKFLSERIDPNFKEYWIEKILKQLNISKVLEYEKRLNDIVTQKGKGNKRATEFYESLDAIKQLETQLDSNK